MKKAAIRESGEVAPRRERLLDVALDLFSRQGYAATSVSEIVAAAGVSQPVLYYYFQNKQDLFQALVDRSLIAFEQVVRQPPRDDLPCRERLIDLCRRGFMASKVNPVSTRLLFTLAFTHQGDIPVLPKINPIVDRFQEMIETIVREGKRSGEFGPVRPADVSWTIYAIFAKAMEQSLFRLEKEPTSADLTRILRQVLAGFATGAGE